MKIELRSLHVKGCGPLEDVTIDFTDAEGKPRPVTVIAGANGSGKTTVLESIVGLAEMLQSNEFNNLNNTFFRNLPDLPTAIPYSRVLQEAKQIKIDWTVSDGGFHQINGLLLNFSKNEERHLNYWSLERKQGRLQLASEEINGLAAMIRWQAGQNITSLTSLYPNKIISPSILYFPHPRKIFPVSGTQLTDEETRYHWVYRYENAQDFKGSLDAYLCWLAFIEPERPGVFTEVTEFLDSLDFDGKKFNLKRTKLKATVTTREGHTHFLEELSAGEQNILIMLLELRRRLLPGSIVLIDEIESSLHEAYQHMLAQALLKIQRDIPFQLIVTTHSKTIAKIFGWDSVVILTDF